MFTSSWSLEGIFAPLTSVLTRVQGFRCEDPPNREAVATGFIFLVVPHVRERVVGCNQFAVGDTAAVPTADRLLHHGLEVIWVVQRRASQQPQMWDLVLLLRESWWVVAGNSSSCSFGRFEIATFNFEIWGMVNGPWSFMLIWLLSETITENAT